MAFFKLLERKRKRVGAERGGMKRERNKAGGGRKNRRTIESTYSLEEILAASALMNPVGTSLSRT